MKTQVNNEIYKQLGHAWWDDDVGIFSTIRFFVNPVRFSYFMRMMAEHGVVEANGKTVLDVGCGGGFLSEDFARAGYVVTGVDPAAETIDTARAHAAASGLSVTYVTGSGESMSFADASFDIVVCCDVLEHVDDMDRVIAEISRVLKPDGLFFFDTINRTFASYVFMIKVMQDWRATAFAEKNSHVWRKFIKPSEIETVLAKHSMTCRGYRGIMARSNPISSVLNFRRRVKGEISFRELGSRLKFGESDSLNASYMGWAKKTRRNLRSSS